ncbi:sulfite exporter TauE/SafE family protein [Bacillus sp. 522_BSPC]|uniref:sulfite exporter TauE/SafE family protein n=1 Tax=Bacillus sp. 522_BSPC TaxID=1579338 RepID=UPI0006601469|nr:sulfite exporter TauE/SafE family protein [Bacillus sp. 522_BSPC]REB74189.1 sulfite exporter TauE/SafE family protein [Cutibacterium acnes]
MIFTTMLLMGLILGFSGTGGSGFIISLLVVVFDVPIHTALGVSLASMFCSTLSGSISHFREGNVQIKTGIYMGLSGGIGAYIGTMISSNIEEGSLVWMTGGMLILSALLVWIRTRRFSTNEIQREKQLSKNKYMIITVCSGIGTGLLSGIFGIGSTPFIQLALLVFLGFSLRQSVGTTMLVIVPIAFSAVGGFMQTGNFSIPLFLQVTLGTMIGSYIGAKFTNKAPTVLLRTAMVATPLAGGLLIILNLFR